VFDVLGCYSETVRLEKSFKPFVVPKEATIKPIGTVKEERRKLKDRWSKQYGKPITESELAEIETNLRAFADILFDSYEDFKRKGLIDEHGNLKRGK